MRRIILPSVACMALQYFSTLFKKYMIFGKKVFEHEMCFFPLQHQSETFLILRRIQRDVITNAHRALCEMRDFIVTVK